MKVKVLYHNHCFDGVCSAAVFSYFYKNVINSQAEFVYHGLTHGPNNMFRKNLFDLDEHVIVDFKYTSSPALNWWFDHHQSAFLSKDDEAHFYSDTSGKKFYNPHYKSCTKFIADTVMEKFNFGMESLKELIQSADIIDGAQYSSAEEAIDLTTPAAQIALVIESTRSQDLIHYIIHLIQGHTLLEISKDPKIQQVFEPLLERHNQAAEIIKNKAVYSDGVVFFDLSDCEIDGYNKFIVYSLFPKARYNVGITHGDSRCKISVGYNPWCNQEREHNLATICERYGGGGHPVVGAISYSPNDIEKTRKVAKQVVKELSQVSI